jgi:hypothetical protein
MTPATWFVDDDRHRREYVDADAAADRVDRRRWLVGLANPQGRPILTLQRRGDFLDMGQRLAYLVASGDHDAARIKDTESGQRNFLCFKNDRHQPLSDLTWAGDAAQLPEAHSAVVAAGRRRQRDRARAGSA